MDQILQTLLTMTTTASVAALCVMGLRLLLKRAPRWITCLLWMVVFVRMVCPVSFSLPVSLVPAPIAQGTYVQQAGQALEASSRAQAPAPADTGGPADQGASAGPDRTDVVVGLWGAGTLGMLLWGGVSYLRLRRRTGEAIRLEGNLYETDQIAAPFVCGVFSPKIYLPVGLDPQDRPYVLLHEQAHLRRRDHLTKPLAWLALCLHWCNPLLWLAYRLFCRDLETACDALAPRTPPNTPPPCCTWDTAASCPRRCPWPLGRRTPRDASGTYWTINGPRSGWQGSRCWCVRPPSS